MYTQCPECSVAFRVTAEVLKQAAGKVRCGGCGNAFNALQHLSEEKPDSAPPPAAEPELPELTPELRDDDGTVPKAISAEQSAALLKTLDQLAGEDIRIEDTGVEWRVLDEADIEADEAEEEHEAPDVVNSREAPTVEMRFDDNTPLPDDFELDREPTLTPEPIIEEQEPPSEDAQADLALGDPDEWQDLLGEVAEADLVSAADEEPDAEEPVHEEAEPAEPAAEPVAADPEPITDEPLDMDTQFALQAEAMGIDLSGIHGNDREEKPDEVETAIDIKGFEPEPDEVDPADTSIEEDLIAAAFEAEAAARAEVSAAEELLEDLADFEAPADEAIEAEQLLEGLAMVEASEDKALAEELEEQADLEVDADEEHETNDDGEEEPTEDEIEEEDAEDRDDDTAEDDIAEEIDAAAEAAADYHMADMSEEEKTINMMIDQDLLAVAIEDEDGFTSTIVQKQVISKDDIPGEKADTSGGEEEATVGKPAVAGNPLVETIIMEGESIRGEVDPEKEAENASFIDQARKSVAAPFKSSHEETPSSSIGISIGIVVLLLLLAGQFIHQSREALATIPAFNHSIAPIYRSVGRPVTPAWDVSGWRFEATKGSTDEGDEHLTIYSRVGNTSDKALPYPLLHVSLTDRFEETIGSRVLEPAEYLVDNPDPHKPVQPGATFNAVISIATPALEATGFKLNVCYRLASGQLRCANEDFK